VLGVDAELSAERLDLVGLLLNCLLESKHFI
jgi:hypothetical protein